jgi:nucleoid DNA-binding protein
MKRDDLARTLAREGRLSGAAARDRIDEVVHKILRTLRTGKPVKLPGVGRLIANRPARNK